MKSPHKVKSRQARLLRYVDMMADAAGIVMALRDNPSRLDWFAAGTRMAALGIKLRSHVKRNVTESPWRAFLSDEWRYIPDAIDDYAIKHAEDVEVIADFSDADDELKQFQSHFRPRELRRFQRPFRPRTPLPQLRTSALAAKGLNSPNFPPTRARPGSSSERFPPRARATKCSAKDTHLYRSLTFGAIVTAGRRHVDAPPPRAELGASAAPREFEYAGILALTRNRG